METKKKTKITDKIAVTLMKKQIKQRLTDFFQLFTAMKDRWINAGKIEPFEEFIQKAMDEFNADFNSVIEKMIT